ncbi:DNA-binding transcriptional MerR regulator [Crossiella equi]|uniref:DNA-binding transcriptional MerR regulator n=1 Tax=Crossiella equi TaxID=130796 RepID=A0ABS5AM52_9PSEU|nr:MerR family transcriptional regulator [Crossiella equi]MBP2477477.1 DNA-binding transcriptional MerR regulator [Crossiella equi]
MRIGELADLVGASTRALRYYEEQGLLPARRGANGHRKYTEHDLRLVREIRSLLDIGFSLEETRPFVDCLRAGNEAGDSCPASVAVYRVKLAELEDRMARLAAVRERLVTQLAKATAPATEPACAFSVTRPVTAEES